MTCLEYQAAMKHAIGNADPATGISLLTLLNQALRQIVDYHDWSWRKRSPALLDLVASQTYVSLPSDFGFGQILTFHSIFNPTLFINKVNLSDIATMRGSVYQNSLVFYVALSWPSQASVGVAPGQARLEIWPTPLSSVTGAFRCVYLAGSIDMANDSDVPNIPPAFEEALVLLARGKARQYELDGDMTDTTAAMARLQELMIADGLQDTDAGYISGGAVQQGRFNLNGWRPFTTASIPSH